MQKFFQGAFLLIAANLINRILGFIYKVYTVRLIGAEGIGLFELVFPIYNLVLVLTTAGIPLAIPKLISEEFARHNYKQVKKIFLVALFILATSGFLSTTVLLWSAPYLSIKFFSDQRVYWSFVVTLPAIFIVAISSAFRGYFQGMQNMLPGSTSQVVEQIVRFTVGIIAVQFLLPYGLELAAAGLALAMVSGEFAGLLSLVAFFWKKRINQISLKYFKNERTNILRILSSIYKIAIPTTLTRVILAATLTAEAIIIPIRLINSGLTMSQATQSYGQFSGMAFSLINLPTIITVSLAISLVPAISEALALNDYNLIRKRTNQVLKITIYTAIPCLVIFFYLSRNIMQVVYNTTEASAILATLALGCPFFYLQQTTNGILQGLGKVNLIFKNALIGSIVTLAGIYWLTALPNIGIQGASMAVIAGSVIISYLNFVSLLKFTHLKPNWFQILFAPIFGGIGMYYFLNSFFQNIGGWFSLVWACMLSFALYSLILIITGCIKLKRIYVSLKWF
ncbi:stage V sporulation protein B [Bacillota bacterium LX-D]|nr:stage V sporulation protein B [Bacillota bacterium LX-D]